MDRSQFKLTLDIENFSVSWRAKFYGSTNDDNYYETAYYNALNANPNAEKPYYLDLDSEFVHDLYSSYQFEASDVNAQIFIGIKNVLNNDGPFLPSGTDGGARNESETYGTVKGRYAYVGFKLELF